MAARTMVELLQDKASSKADPPVYTFLVDGETRGPAFASPFGSAFVSILESGFASPFPSGCSPRTFGLVSVRASIRGPVGAFIASASVGAGTALAASVSSRTA